MNEDLIKRPLLAPDEEFDTVMEVERNPTGAWMAIQEQANSIDELKRDRDALAIVVKFYDEDKKQRDGFFKKWFGISTQEEMIAQYNRLMKEEAVKNKEDRLYGDERYTDHGRIED